MLRSRGCMCVLREPSLPFQIGTNLERDNPGGLAELQAQLRRRGSTVEELGAALKRAIPMTIAVNYSPDGSDNHVQARDAR